ncbi:MAG: type I-B CRISPR-associated protein Cas7/Cst2/DevR [Thermacetogeniaceae bacterium]
MMLVNRDKFKALGVTATVVFESSAVNRDEKIAESIQSIKKLGRRDGTYSFMSRAFIRHHMFVALRDLYGWQPAPVTKDGDVLQFDFPEANIVSYPELDLFGFMRTNPFTVTRKAPLGVTKAISLEPWQGDMAFYANHDLVARAVRRGTKANPNPFSKEEHYSLYRISYTLDLCRFGQQEVIAGADDPSINDWLGRLTKASASEVGERVERLELEDGWEWYAIPLSQSVASSAISAGRKVCDPPGYVGVKSAKDEGCRLLFVVADEEYRKRLEQVLNIIAAGFSLHSSTESYGTNPQFCVMAALRVPVPVFHPAIGFADGEISADLLARARKNSHIIRAWYESLLPLSEELKEGDFIRGIDAGEIAEFVYPAEKKDGSGEAGA